MNWRPKSGKRPHYLPLTWQWQTLGKLLYDYKVHKSTINRAHLRVDP
jgi:hypothetical protein